MPESLLPGVDPSLVALGVGALLLLFGRRLYFLVLGVVGFTGGWWLAEWLQGVLALPVGVNAQLLFGVLLGVACALLAFVLQRFVVAIAGFLIGAIVALWPIQVWLSETGPLVWLGVVLAGLLGALLLVSLFDVALVVLSSMVGGALFLEGLADRLGDRLVIEAQWLPIAYLFVVLVGSVFQSRALRRREKDD